MKRTPIQNNALHLFFEQMAQALNDQDKLMSKKLVIELYKDNIEIPWTKNMVKEMLWKPLQKAMTGKDSTTQIEKIDVNPVYEVLCKHLAEKLGFICPEFPSEQNEKENH